MSSKLQRTNKNTDGIIPFSTGYRITEEGKVYNPLGNEINPRPDKNGDLIVGIGMSGITPMGLYLYKVSSLMVVVYRNANIEPNLWNKIECYHLDNNKSNVHTDNLINKIYPEEFSKVVEGISYKLIPGYTRYGISRNGDIMRLKDNRMMTLRPNEKGYYCGDLSSDITERSKGVKRHRLLGLAYIPYPSNVDELDINHRDGIPGSDDLGNLEWMTRRDNVLHAINTGLHSRVRPLYARDINTGEVTRYNSVNQAGDIIGIGHTTILDSIRDGGVSKIMQPHHRYCDHLPEDWGTDIPDANDIMRVGKLFLLRDGLLIDILGGLRYISNSGLGLIPNSKTTVFKKFREKGGANLKEGYYFTYVFDRYSYDGTNIYLNNDNPHLNKVK